MVIKIYELNKEQKIHLMCFFEMNKLLFAILLFPDWANYVRGGKQEIPDHFKARSDRKSICRDHVPG